MSSIDLTQYAPLNQPHAPLAPSSAARWVQCPGSVVGQLASPLPDDDPEASEEGTAAHELGATILRGDPVPHTDDAEMFESAAMYGNTILKLVSQQVEHVELHIEERVTCPTIHEHNYGTPDAWMFNRATMTLDVFDFKYGHGYVEVFENWQLMNYAVGILLQLGIKTTPMTINLHIIQPRSYHRDGPHRIWSLRLADLYEYEARLRAAAHAAMADNPPFVTGPECKYCRARNTCPALLTVGYSAIEASSRSMPLEMTPQVTGMVLRQVRTAMARLTAIETGLTQQAEHILRNGGRVPGYHLESKPSARSWKVPTTEVIALGDMMCVPLGKPVDVITPTQAIKAGIPETVIDVYSERKSGAAKLAEDGVRLVAVFGKGGVK